MGLSAESRQQVEDLVGKALAAGGQDLGESEDDGLMYIEGSATLTATGGRSST